MLTLTVDISHIFPWSGHFLFMPIDVLSVINLTPENTPLIKELYRNLLLPFIAALSHDEQWHVIKNKNAKKNQD